MFTEIDDVLELIGFRGTQLLMLACCAMSMMYTVCEVMSISIVVVSIACEFNLNHSHLILVTSAAFLGMVVISPYSGYKTDQLGRRRSLLWFLSLGLTSSFISLLLPEFYSFVFFRFLTGIFLSGCITTSFTYVMEYTKISLRPSLANIFTYAICLTSIIAPFIAFLLEPLDAIMWSWSSFHVRVWRLCMLLNFIPGIFAVVALLQLPETAKFKLSKHQPEEAYKTLDRLYIRNHGKNLASVGVTSVTEANLRESILKVKRNLFARMWSDTVPLLKPPYLLPFLHHTLIITSVFFVGNGLALWFIKIRSLLSDDDRILCDNLKGIEQKSEGSACLDKVQYTDGIVLGTSSLCACLFISLCLLCLSRRSIIFINSVLSAVSGFSLNFVKRSVPQLVAMVIFISMCTSSITLASSAIADSVPTHLRGKAISLVFMVSRLSVVLANVIIGYTLSNYCLITFNMFVLVVAAAAILTLFLHR